MKRHAVLCFILIFIFILAGCSSSQPTPPKNIILLIGDGMGPSHIKAFRVFKDDSSTQEIDPLMLDRYLVGTLATSNSVGLAEHTSEYQKNRASQYLEGGAYQVTDSAASATAYSTGVRSYNGAIGLDADKGEQQTVLELAKSKGLKTGLVATSQINHATPAAFISHVESRQEYNQIADAFVDNTVNGEPVIDVFLGGGWQYFNRKDRNLVSELQQKNFAVITEAQQLDSAADRVAGLFSDKGLPRVLDREAKHPSLKQMTKAAIQRLDNENGFFLMVEGSQIDWASHGNDIAGTLYEMDDFYQAIEAAIEFADKDGETLVLVTADHETGGLSVGRRIGDSSFYTYNVQPLKRMQKSLNQYASELTNTADLTPFLSDLGIQLSDEESAEWDELKNKLESSDAFDFLRRVVNRSTYTGWTTNGHTGVDVNLYAMGKGADKFRGHHPNTFIGHQIKIWLNQK